MDENPYWSDKDKQALLEQVAQQVGSKGSFKLIRSRMKWGELDIAGHSAEECSKMFGVLTDKIRKYRLFHEIIEEAKEEVKNGFSYQHCTRHFPDFPKKPAAPTNLFYKDQEDLKKLKGPKLIQTLNKRWNALADDKKEKYRKKYLKKLKAYYEKLRKFQEDHPDVHLAKRATSKDSKLRPKLPVLPSPQLLYAEAHKDKIKSKHPDLNGLQVHAKCVTKFNKLKDSKKLKWILRAQDMLPEYESQCETYLESNPEAKLKPAVLKLSKEDRSLLWKHEGRPEAPPINVFYFFTTHLDEYNEELAEKLKSRHFKLSERQKFVSESYKSLTEDKKEEIEKAYKQVVRSYIDEFTKYYDSLPPERQESEMPGLNSLSKFQKVIERPLVKRGDSEEDGGQPSKKSKVNNKKASADPKKWKLRDVHLEAASGSNNVKTKRKRTSRSSSSESSTQDEPQQGSTKPGKEAQPPKSLNNIDEESIDDALLSFAPKTRRASKRLPSTKANGSIATASKSSDPANDEGDLSVKSKSNAGSKSKSSPVKKRKLSQVEQSAALLSEAEVDSQLSAFFSPIKIEQGQPEEDVQEKMESPRKKRRKVKQDHAGF